MTFEDTLQKLMTEALLDAKRRDELVMSLWGVALGLTTPRAKPEGDRALLRALAMTRMLASERPRLH